MITGDAPQKTYPALEAGFAVPAETMEIAAEALQHQRYLEFVEAAVQWEIRWAEGFEVGFPDPEGEALWAMHLRVWSEVAPAVLAAQTAALAGPVAFAGSLDPSPLVTAAFPRG